MLRLVVLSGSHAGKTLPLNDGKLLVGRGNECGARLSGPEVSRRHCLFAEEQGNLVVEDLRSRNGTLVNGEKINLRTTLKDGDRVTVCSLEILVSAGDPTAREVSEWIREGAENRETEPQPTPHPSPTPDTTHAIEDLKDSRLHPGHLPTKPAQESSRDAAEKALRKFFGRG